MSSVYNVLYNKIGILFREYLILKLINIEKIYKITHLGKYILILFPNLLLQSEG